MVGSSILVSYFTSVKVRIGVRPSLLRIWIPSPLGARQVLRVWPVTLSAPGVVIEPSTSSVSSLIFKV
jgi:hypothetical protein